MRVVWYEEAWEQYTTWQDRAMIKRIHRLIKDIERDDDAAIGKPELLRGELSGYASRRINDEHRLIYRIRNDDIEIISCRWHYEK